LAAVDIVIEVVLLTQ